MKRYRPLLVPVLILSVPEAEEVLEVTFGYNFRELGDILLATLSVLSVQFHYIVVDGLPSADLLDNIRLNVPH